MTEEQRKELQQIVTVHRDDIMFSTKRDLLWVIELVKELDAKVINDLDTWFWVKVANLVAKAYPEEEAKRIFQHLESYRHTFS